MAGDLLQRTDQNRKQPRIFFIEKTEIGYARAFNS